MISGKQILWGTLGWAFGGPIGGILGVIFAGSGDQSSYKSIKQSQAGDFMVSLLVLFAKVMNCLLYTSPSPRDRTRSRMPSSA